MHACMHTNIHTYMHTYIHIYIYICIYIYIYVQPKAMIITNSDKPFGTRAGSPAPRARRLSTWYTCYTQYYHVNAMPA